MPHVLAAKHRQSMHTPNPGSDPRPDDSEPDVRKPPVPPDQEGEVIPQRDPPAPGRGEDRPPLIA
jgi:hypothetical protein